MLLPEQVNQLKNDPTIKATVAANQAAAVGARDAALMLLGYNQALHDCANWPEGHTAQSWDQIIEGQKATLGIMPDGDETTPDAPFVTWAEKALYDELISTLRRVEILEADMEIQKQRIVLLEENS